MGITSVVHKNKDFYHVYIGKGSIWHNPFVIGRDGTREEVIQKFENYLLSNLDLLAQLPSLKGKILGCYCKPLPCHGDILAKYVNKLI